MSVPRSISPMLDGFLLGEAYSCRDAVQCCPALDQQTGEKYIVKIISFPKSRTQMAALLLVGAFPDRESVNNYFKEQAREVLQEAKALRDMARGAGFVDFDCFQVVPGEDNIGFEFYLLSPYRQSLESILESDIMTHLGIVNLGIDLCNALSLCRMDGYRYAALKATNIFQTDNGFCIGDLGLVPAENLQLYPFPERFISDYTPAELLEDPSAWTDTADTYALGLLMYQAYNGGKLPRKEEASGTSYLPPLYADYEMAEIILRACSLDPAHRYETPDLMAQDLVRYAQRNGIEDVPVIPPAMPKYSSGFSFEEPFLPEQPPEPEELAFFSDLTQDETAPSAENTEGLSNAALTAETSAMLDQADSLISHVLPTPPSAPEPVEIPMPDPIVVTPLPQPESTLAQPEEKSETTPPPKPMSVRKTHKNKPAPRKRRTISKKMIGRICIAALALFLAVELIIGLSILYKRSHRHEIQQLVITGDHDSICVELVSQASEKLLTVVCTDSYGNTYRSSVTNGIAAFESLRPGSYYRIEITAKKGHQLLGAVDGSFTTVETVDILHLQVAPAKEADAAVLQITSADPGFTWIVTCEAENQSARSVTFSSPSITLRNLTPGIAYTFTVSAENGAVVTGPNRIAFTLPTP